MAADHHPTDLSCGGAAVPQDAADSPASSRAAVEANLAATCTGEGVLRCLEESSPRSAASSGPDRPTALQQKCPGDSLCMLSLPAPLGEAVEHSTLPEADASNSCKTQSWAVASQTQLPDVAAESAAPADSTHSTSCENVADMMERVRVLLSCTQARNIATGALASIDSCYTTAAQPNTVACIPALAAAATAAVCKAHAGTGEAVSLASQVGALDMSEFLTCYSPSAKSRPPSRHGSPATACSPLHARVAMSSTSGERILAAARASGASAQGPLASAAIVRPYGSKQSSPRAGDSVPNLDAFWAESSLYSDPATRNNSRHFCADATPQQHRSSAEETAVAPAGALSCDTSMEAMPSAAVTDTACISDAVGPDAIVCRNGKSSSPSKKALLLHGPSRLSIETAAAIGSETFQQASPTMQQQPICDQPGSSAGTITRLVQPAHEALMLQALVPDEDDPVPVTAAELLSCCSEDEQAHDTAQLAQQQTAVESTRALSERQQQHQEGSPTKRKSLKRMLFDSLGKDSRDSADGLLSQQQQQQQQWQSPLEQQPPPESGSHKWGLWGLFARGRSRSGSSAASDNSSPHCQLQAQQLEPVRSAQPGQQAKAQAHLKELLDLPVFAVSSRSCADAQGKVAREGQVEEGDHSSVEIGPSDVKKALIAFDNTPAPNSDAADAAHAAPLVISLDAAVQPATIDNPQQAVLSMLLQPNSTSATAVCAEDTYPRPTHAAGTAVGKAACTKAGAGCAQQLPHHVNSPHSAAAAGGLCESPAVQTLASSLQRIADFLDDFLTDRSPKLAQSPLRCSRTQPSSQSPLTQVSSFKEQPAETCTTPASPAPQSTLQSVQQHTEELPPAAAAAKARLLSCVAASDPADARQPQSVSTITQADHVAGCLPQTTEPSGRAADMHAIVDPLCSEAVGWSHPSVFDSRQVTACSDVQQHDSNKSHQVATTGVEEESDAADAAATGTPSDGLLLLASRVVGFDLLLNSSQQANSTCMSASKPDEGLQQQQLQNVTAGIEQQPRTAQLQSPSAAAAACRVDMKVSTAAASMPTHAATPPSSPVRSSLLERHSPTSLQHPRLWRPANIRVPRTRLNTAQLAANTDTGAFTAGDVNLHLQDVHHYHHHHEQQQQQQAMCSLLAPYCDLQSAAVQVGPASTSAHVSNVMFTMDPNSRVLPVSAINEGMFERHGAAADVKLIQREPVRTVRLLRPGQLWQASPYSTQQLQPEVQKPHPTVSSHAAANESPILFCTGQSSSMHHVDAAAAAWDGHAAAVKLVKFPIRVQANLLQPPILTHTLSQPKSAGQKHTMKRNVSEGVYSMQDQQQQANAVSSGGGTQQQRSKATDIHQYQQDCQALQHHSVAPWEANGQSLHSAGSPDADEGMLTAGRRAAQLLNALQKQQTAPVQDTYAAGREHQSSTALAAKQHQVLSVQGIGIQTDSISRDAATEPIADTLNVLSQPCSPQHHHSGPQHRHRSPIRRMRRPAAAGTVRWLALQQLKARNRMHRQDPARSKPGSIPLQQHQQQAADVDGSAAAQRLLDQLQQFMPFAGRDADTNFDILQSGDVASAVPRLDLDAVAATALYEPQHLEGTAQQQQPDHQQHRVQSPSLEDSLSLSQLEGQQAAAPGTHSPEFYQQKPAVAAKGTAAVGAQYSPLLLPRMLSRAPLVDAGVQAGIPGDFEQLPDKQQLLTQQLQLQQQQQVLAQQQHRQRTHSAVEPVKVVLTVTGDVAHPGAHSQQQQQQPMPQLQHAPPVSPAAIVALAAAAGAGAASAVQANSPSRYHDVTAAVAAPPQQQQQQQPLGVSNDTAELARLIADAFKHAGGVITPNKHALNQNLLVSDSNIYPKMHKADVQQQKQQRADFVPNPLAGRAAPQFSQVVDYIPPATENSSTMLDQQVWVDQQKQREPLLMLPSVGNRLSPYEGCCFAACPQRIPSPTFKGSTTAPVLHIPGKHSQQQRSRHHGQADSRTRGRKTDKSAAVNSSKASTSVNRDTSRHQQGTTNSRLVTAGGHKRKHQHVCKHQQRHRHAAAIECIDGVQQQQVLVKSRGDAPLNDWASQQTRQLADLWQQWQQQQGRSQRQQLQQQDKQHAGNENQDPKPAASTGLLKQHQVASQSAVVSVDSAADNSYSRPAVYTAARYMEPPGDAQAAASVSAGDPCITDSTSRANEQQYDQQIQQEREALDAAYHRAAAARSAAKAAAKRAAAARSQRFRAELLDLSKLLAEVDTLAAQMEAEAADTAAALSGIP